MESHHRATERHLPYRMAARNSQIMTYVILSEHWRSQGAGGRGRPTLPSSVLNATFSAVELMIFIPATCILRAFYAQKCVCGRGSARTRRDFQRSLAPLAGGEGASSCLLQRTPPTLSAFGLNFRPFWPQSAPPNSNFWLRIFE